MTITSNKNLVNFEFWGGARDRANSLTYDELDTIERALDECYPDGIDETQLNDIFWFDFDWIAELLGYENEEDFDRKRNGEDEEDEEDNNNE